MSRQMHIPADFVQFFNHLSEIADEHDVFNEDGTELDPAVELAVEIYGVKRQEVTQNHYQAVRHAISAARNGFAQGGFAAHHAQSSTFGAGPSAADMKKAVQSQFDEMVRQHKNRM